MTTAGDARAQWKASMTANNKQDQDLDPHKKSPTVVATTASDRALTA
jgi:hypothetical protein